MAGFNTAQPLSPRRQGFRANVPPPHRAADLDMSLSTSPARDVTKLMGRRSLSTIPKDQRSLLERETAWAVDLKDGPHGLATVPSHVLATLKEAFIRLKDENEKEKPEAEREEEENSEPAPVVVVNNGEEQNGYSPGSARSSMAPPSSPERPIVSSWPASVVGSGSGDDQGQGAASEPGSPVDETATMPLPEMLTQPPPAQIGVTLTPGSPSSTSEPEDLEMELPQAQENIEAPINRVATTHLQLTAPSQELTSLEASLATVTDTPPCAQPRVASAPCTSSETPKSSTLPANAEKRRRRRMKPIEFSEDNSPKAAGPFARAITEPAMHNSTSLSSASPAPFHDGRRESLPPPPPPHNFAKHAAPQINKPGHGAPEMPSIRPVSMKQLYRIQAAVDTAIDQHMEPYGAFAATYPDYATVHSGNLYSFVQACIVLRMLQDERAIREYLYDDFIRAWSSGYLAYAHNAGPGQDTLKAIEWFNMLKGPILFNRMCVNQANIDVVLHAYPEEVARCRAILDARERQEEHAAPRPAPEVDMELDPEPGREQEHEVEVVDLLDSDSAMDIGMEDERRRPDTPPAMRLPPPSRRPPSLPAPSRTAPPPPPPRALSPEQESDDFASPPLPPKPPSQARPPIPRPPVPQTQQQPPPPRTKTRPQPQPQPRMQMTLPERQSPKRRPTTAAPAPAPVSVPVPIALPTSAAPLVSSSSSTRRPPTKASKSTHAKSSAHPAEYLGPMASSSGRAGPGSSGRPIPKLHRRTAEERVRLKEHFRKAKKPSSSTSGVDS